MTWLPSSSVDAGCPGGRSAIGVEFWHDLLDLPGEMVPKAKQKERKYYEFSVPFSTPLFEATALVNKPGGHEFEAEKWRQKWRLISWLLSNIFRREYRPVR